ncbi:MAG: hypothetical protein J0M15_09995 [Deltaproteobacteria bacterium]|jgi:hypothetical protein|nr:hypothetical protein [Deltaproteobacteria bacterium]
MKDFKLRPLSIILKMHSLRELKAIYSEVFSESPSSELSHLQLVKEISGQTTLSELVGIWDSKLYAHNTTLKLYQAINLKNENKIESGIKKIKSHFNDEAWAQLFDEGYAPNKLPNEGRLLHISKLGNKYYFLFVYPGRAKEVIEELSVRHLIQPLFVIAVWDNDESTLQLRGQERAQLVAAKFENYLNSEKEPVGLSHLYIKDKDAFDEYKKALDGRGMRGKVTNPDQEVAELTLVASPDTELMDTKKYKDLIDEDYTLNSAGIDFEYDGQTYTVWIGFKTGTFWIRAGDVTEELISYAQEKLLEVLEK